jgi:hypothetical protein
MAVEQHKAGFLKSNSGGEKYIAQKLSQEGVTPSKSWVKMSNMIRQNGSHITS